MGRERQEAQSDRSQFVNYEKNDQETFQLENSESPLGLSCAQRTLGGQDCNEMSVTWLHPAFCLPPCDFSQPSIPTEIQEPTATRAPPTSSAHWKRTGHFQPLQKKRTNLFCLRWTNTPVSTWGQGQYLCLSGALGALRHSNLNRGGLGGGVVNQN